MTETAADSGRGRRALAEGIGTFFLVLIGPGAVMVDAYTHGALGPTGIALAFALVVVALVYALGHTGSAGVAVGVTVGFCALLGPSLVQA
jgi:glycerol uptake facilitator-like aquaporin